MSQLATRLPSVEAWLAARRAWLQTWLAAHRERWQRYRDAHASSPVKRYLDAHLAMVVTWCELQPLAGVTRWLDARRESSKGAWRGIWSAVRQIRYALPTLAAVALVVFAMGGRWRLASAMPPSQNGVSFSATPIPTTPGASSAPPTTTANTPTSIAANKPSTTATTPSTTANTPSQSSPSPGAAAMFGAARPWKKPAIALTGKLNLNTATEEQLMMLPTVGPAKAERIMKWRTMNGGFRRIADIRRVKGFGYKTFKRLEAFLEVSGETTLH